MSTHNKDDDFQLRVRKIANGFLVVSGDQFFCKDIEDVLDRIDTLLTLQLKPFESTRSSVG
ncbi:MAG: hypothetical protein GOVbin2729_44 [Prokaryotic dsDNA virus sp.]|nr:MAG: hypothetical protein GOVbin2729_44 [Prokaryotic dsDNA virus sp.]|tara:strand:+ start:1155 stop:1337 length:183 start_codon:yes stop_codon:yes gene_type:complete